MPFTDSLRTANVVLLDKDSLDAESSDVLENKKFIGTSPVVSSGTIPINTEETDITLSAGASKNIPYGYNPSSYTVSAKSLESQTEGTATGEDILLNKTAWVNGTKIYGEMPNNGAGGAILNCGETYEIQEGYYDGTGTITVESLESQTEGTATGDNILLNRTAWVNGTKIYGEMPNNGTIEVTLSSGETFQIPEGYHNGDGLVSVESLESQTEGTAISNDIVANKTAWVDGIQITGSMTNNDAESHYIPINGSYTIPEGYHDGNGQVTQNIPTKNGDTISAQNVEQIIELAGYYMQGNIKIRAVDAMNYQFPNAIMKNNNNESILNYECIPDGNPAKCKIKFASDNWHDNTTTNIYKVKIEEQYDNNGTIETIFSLETFITISKAQSSSIIIDNNQIISIGFEQEYQYIEIYPYKNTTEKIIVTITDIASFRQYI